MNNIERLIHKITEPSIEDLNVIDLSFVTNCTLGYWKYNQLPTKNQFKEFMKDVKNENTNS